MSSRRASYVVVGGLTALVAVIAVVWIALTLRVFAYAFGYVVAALLIGGVCASTAVGVSLLRRVRH